VLQHVSAVTVGNLQGAHKFLACAAYAPTYMLGILHTIQIIITNIKCYNS